MVAVVVDDVAVIPPGFDTTLYVNGPYPLNEGAVQVTCAEKYVISFPRTNVGSVGACVTWGMNTADCAETSEEPCAFVEMMVNV